MTIHDQKNQFQTAQVHLPVGGVHSPVCPGVLRDADLRRQRGCPTDGCHRPHQYGTSQCAAEEAGDKMYEMSRRFGDEDAFTAIGAIGEEQKKAEELEHGYSEDELNKLDAAEAERIRQQQEMEELERSLAESRRHINSFAYGDNASSGNRSGNGSRTATSTTTDGYTSQDEFAKDLKEIQRRSYERQKAIESGLGIGRFDRDEQAEKQRKDSIARVRQAEKERNRPKLVIKSGDTNAEKFHTVTSPDDVAEAKLIRAMIDQTTKAKEGTRLRFKLLDDITVSQHPSEERHLPLWYSDRLRTATCEGYHYQHSGR